MKCWLCARSLSLGYIDNPFQPDTSICSKCADCLESSFDIERPSAARLMHEIGRKAELSILQIEERWLRHKVGAFEAISAAAFVEGDLTALEERLAALDKSWEEQPSHPTEISSMECPFFWAVYQKSSADSQAVLDKAARKASVANQSVSSLHVLWSIIGGRRESEARTVLLLAGFDPKSSARALALKLRTQDASSDTLQLTAELSDSLKQWLSSRHGSYIHSGSLLSAVIGSESLAYEFLKEHCNLDTLTELLSKLKQSR